MGLTTTGFEVLAGSLALAAGGLGLGYEAVAGIGVAGAVLVGLGGLGGLIRPRLDVTRTVTQTSVNAGEPVRAVLQIRNRSRCGGSGLTVVEQVGSATAQPVQVPTLRPGLTRVSYEVATSRRGVMRLGPLRWHRQDQFGLWHRQFECGEVVEVTVRPRLHPVEADLVGTRRSLEGRARDTASEGSIAFHSLREYVPGDDRRSIHWRSTARTGTVMVRRNLDVTLPSLAVLVDTRAASYQQNGLDEAVEVAASLVAATLTAGFEIQLATTGALRWAATRPEEISAVLDGLARVAPDASLGFVEVVEALEPRPGSTLVVITGTGPADVDDAAAVQAIARRHDAGVGIVVGPDPNGVAGVDDLGLPAILGADVVYGVDAAAALKAWSCSRAGRIAG
jgi:uncharacterized protein (DUF58 family)